MLPKDMSRVDIEEAIKGKGDFVKIEYLERFLKGKIPTDRKRFIYQKLVEIYEGKRMWTDAAKVYNNLALISVSTADKRKNHVKEAEMYIRADKFDFVDDVVKKAIQDATQRESNEVYATLKEFYKKQAETYEKEKRRSHAIKIYEKLLYMNIPQQEKEEIKKRLISLYEKTGRLREYFAMKGDKKL